MWQSFAAIGRGISEIWLPKKRKKNICGKTEARPELIVPGGLINRNVVYLPEYSIWSVLREKVYRSKIADVDKLKSRLIDE